MTLCQQREAREAAVCDPNRADTNAAVEMLNAFGDVGTTGFDLTITDEYGEKVSFRRDLPVGELHRIIPDLLDRCSGKGWNLIVRPKAPPLFLQLDDVEYPTRERLQHVSFLSLETSPGNYQAWIALSAVSNPDIPRRVRQQVGADPTASGAARIAGSYNFKPKYAPNYPQVAISHSTPGLIVSEEQMCVAGLVAPPVDHLYGPDESVGMRSRRGWPSYSRCLANAPMNHDGSARDRSRADFTFCLIALDWGWQIGEVASRLLVESSKAKRNGERYALATAQRAADAILRRRATSSG